IGQGIVLGLRRELFRHLTSLSLRYFSEQRAGWIIARLTSDVDALSDTLSQGLPTLVTNMVLLRAGVIAPFVHDCRLALSALLIPVIGFLGVVSTAAVLLVGSHVLPATQIGTLAAAYFLLQLAFQPLQELSDVYGQLQSAAAAMVKISSVLDAEPEIHDAEGARTLPRIEGELELDRVVFAYGKEPVLHGVEIRVEPGGCIALVGESGGGKSTSAKLLAWFSGQGSGGVRG